jgi:NADH-quinone oxidoreductase subunit I
MQTEDIEFERGAAYVVDRGEPKMRNGQGMLAGLGVVFKHFRDALTKKLDNPSQTSGVFTIEYPEERMQLPEAFRNFPVLLYEDATGQELCTSCFQCERICPPQVIHITQAKDPANGKAVPAVAEFMIEYDACMSCGLCAEVCPFDAIKMDQSFELATDQHGGLTIDHAGLMRPVSYYAQLAPTFWGEVKDGALKKLQGSAKRRPGLIGIAPQMVEQVRAERERLSDPEEHRVLTGPLTSAVGPTDAKAARLAAIRAANAPRPTAPDDHEEDVAVRSVAPGPRTPPPTDLRPDDPEEYTTMRTVSDSKVDLSARLAAIRAANAAKAAQSADIDHEEQSVLRTPPADTKSDKAARLAAIRAANASKGGAPASPAEPVAPTPEAAAAPAGGAKSDKAARLAAIRAANAAKQPESPEGEQ